MKQSILSILGITIFISSLVVAAIGPIVLAAITKNILWLLAYFGSIPVVLLGVVLANLCCILIGKKSDKT